LVGKFEGRRQLGRPRRRREDRIKMSLKERGWKVVNSIDLVQDRKKFQVVYDIHIRALIVKIQENTNKCTILQYTVLVL
jgi:hypothetical protein